MPLRNMKSLFGLIAINRNTQIGKTVSGKLAEKLEE